MYNEDSLINVTMQRWSIKSLSFRFLDHLFLSRKRFSLNFMNQITCNLIGNENVDKRNYMELENKRMQNKVILI